MKNLFTLATILSITSAASALALPQIEWPSPHKVFPSILSDYPATIRNANDVLLKGPDSIGIYERQVTKGTAVPQEIDIWKDQIKKGTGKSADESDNV